MSNTPAARKRNAWLPNRMFDPVSNPFAIQNLLERDEPPFVAEPDDRPDDAFGVDPLSGGRIVKAFEVDRGLQLPDDDFTVDTDVSGEFVAEEATEEAGFEAEEQPDIYAAFTGDLDEESETNLVSADAETNTDASESLAIVSEGHLPEVIAASDVESEAPSLTAEPESNAEPAVEVAIEEVIEASEAAAEPVSAIEPDATPEPEAIEPPQPELSNEALMQQVEAARAEAYAQGLEAGRSEGRDAERPVARKQGYDEGFSAGVARGKSESQTDEQKRQQQAHDAKLAQLQAVIDNLQQLAYNPDAMFEPVKKLAVHLAEQLVRGELTQSPQAISRLVDNALRELNASGDKAVIIHLNPEDLEAYRPTVANFADSLILRPDTKLERGSVRLSLDGSVVEDLMQRRVDGLKKSMSQAPAPGWRSGGGTLAARVQQGQPVDDVTIVDKQDKTDKTLEAAAPADGHA